MATQEQKDNAVRLLNTTVAQRRARERVSDDVEVEVERISERLRKEFGRVALTIFCATEADPPPGDKLVMEVVENPTQFIPELGLGRLVAKVSAWKYTADGEHRTMGRHEFALSPETLTGVEPDGISVLHEFHPNNPNDWEPASYNLGIDEHYDAQPPQPTGVEGLWRDEDQTAMEDKQADFEQGLRELTAIIEADEELSGRIAAARSMEIGAQQ